MIEQWTKRDPARLSDRDIRRFWSHVDIRGDDECWPWIACRCKAGYGLFYVASHSVRVAHRVSVSIHTGAYPIGVLVCHKCDNPPCCNPLHLFLGTARDNTQDMFKKGRNFVVRGEMHPGSKLTELDVVAIRKFHASGVSSTQIARMGFPVTSRSIRRICRGDRWMHADGPTER